MLPIVSESFEVCEEEDTSPGEEMKGEEGEPPPPLRSFQPRMLALVESARAIDLRAFETATSERCWEELVPAAQRMLRETRALMSELLTTCEAMSALRESAATTHDPFIRFEHVLDAAIQSVESTGATVQAVEDVSFLVDLELRQHGDRMARISARSSTLMIIGECDSALRRIQKGLGAIDIAIARAEGVPTQLDFSSELESSIHVRRAYARFRSRLVGAADPTEAELYARMRAVGTSIAVLVGWREYPLCRLRDRLQLRELQQRILAWLRPEHRSDTAGGMRIWRDVVSFVEMLALVNRRQELIAHDHDRIVELLAQLAKSPPTDDAIVDDVTRARLDCLEGIDDAFDLRLASPTPMSRRELTRLLEAIAPRYGIVVEGSGA